jgi:hypothetical protein
MESDGLDCSESPDRDFSGVLTQYVIDYLVNEMPAGTLERVLRSAGETRPADVLGDTGTWSSYAQFRALLESTGAAIGGPSALTLVGRQVFGTIRSPDLAEALVALGSPAAVFEAIADFAESTTPVVELTTKEIAPTEFLVQHRMKEGHRPFPELCALEIGLLATLPTMFGHPEADFVHEACQCDGAPACRFRLRWESTDENVAKAATAEIRARLSQARLEELQRTVAELVSGDGLESVLRRVVAAAGRAVQALSYVLDVRMTDTSERSVYAEGIDIDQRAELLDRLCAGPTTPEVPHILVADVASDRRHYGRLVTVRAEGVSFEPLERAVLESYARLAASALDSEAVVIEARRQATAARALLDLASSLADLVSSEEMVLRLARAVPSVIDCDRVAIWLTDHDGAAARLSATYGFAPGTDAGLRTLAITVPLPLPDTSEAFRHQVVGPETEMTRALAAGG